MDFLAQAKDIANKDKREVLMVTTKASVNGAVTGLVLGLMIGYWKNDSLVFVGKSGLTYGYAKTLANYKKNYPDTTYMGKLHFDIINLKPLGKAHYFVIGKWQLKRTIGDVGGHFTLLFKKTKNGWKIIADHSS